MIKYEAPVVFDIIMKMTPKSMLGEPPLLLIKIVCRNSEDPSFKKKKFVRYLDEYARLGLYCKRPKRLTPNRREYYEAIRYKKMEKYMYENREKVSNMMKNQENKIN